MLKLPVFLKEMREDVKEIREMVLGETVLFCAESPRSLFLSVPPQIEERWSCVDEWVCLRGG